MLRTTFRIHAVVLSVSIYFRSCFLYVNAICACFIMFVMRMIIIIIEKHKDQLEIPWNLHHLDEQHLDICFQWNRYFLWRKLFCWWLWIIIMFKDVDIQCQPWLRNIRNLPSYPKNDTYWECLVGRDTNTVWTNLLWCREKNYNNNKQRIEMGTGSWRVWQRDETQNKSFSVHSWPQDCKKSP